MNKILFPGIGWFLLLLAPLTFAGFYPSYFSRLPGGMESIYHVHAIFMLIWVAMAIVHRKEMLYHGTYMFAATLTILGPTADRLIYNTLTGFGLPYTFFAEHVVFFFIIMVMAGLLYFQWRNQKPIQPSATALGIFFAGLACFFLLPKTAFWAALIDLIM